LVVSPSFRWKLPRRELIFLSPIFLSFDIDGRRLKSYGNSRIRNSAVRNPSYRRFVSFVTLDPFILKNEANEGNKGKQEVSQEVRVPNEISKSTRAGTYS